VQDRERSTIGVLRLVQRHRRRQPRPDRAPRDRLAQAPDGSPSPEVPPIAAPGAQWTTWSAHRAYLIPTAVLVEDIGRPADSAAIAYRQLAVTTTARGRDGWKASATQSIVFMTLNTVAGNWRVAQIHTAA